MKEKVTFTFPKSTVKKLSRLPKGYRGAIVAGMIEACLEVIDVGTLFARGRTPEEIYRAAKEEFLSLLLAVETEKEREGGEEAEERIGSEEERERKMWEV